MKTVALQSTPESAPAKAKQKGAPLPVSLSPSIQPISVSDRQMVQRQNSCACGGGCPRCAGDWTSSTHLFDGKSDKNNPGDCSPTWFGDTAPEIDQATGGFTGKLVVTYNDAVLKDPCVRECVEQHEAVHVKDLTPIVKKIHDCDVAAGDDWDKKGKCNLMATRALAEARPRSECNAYQKSFTCLTLKVLDSSSPCSKPPHRKEVDKHRGYDGCELKRYCTEAGTPEAGIPNV